MINSETFRTIALSFPGTEEKPHFDRSAFAIINKKIFATLHEKTGTANLLFSLEEQRIYCSFDSQHIYPVPNKFGLKGWTTFELNKLAVELISAALYSAYKRSLV